SSRPRWRRAIAVLERPARLASSSWLARALVVSASRMAASMRSSSEGLESCAIWRKSLVFLHPPWKEHEKSKEFNPAPWYESPAHRRRDMRVGVPKEIKVHEYRVGLTPGAVREYVHAGHGVVVETNAGAGIGASDDVYRKAGAAIADT